MDVRISFGSGWSIGYVWEINPVTTAEKSPAYAIFREAPNMELVLTKIKSTSTVLFASSTRSSS
jgi:hypothetical protein